MRPVEGLEGFRPPLQERSRATLRDIDAAVSEMLEGALPDEISVEAIVERAGTSVGAFYTRFTDKRVAFHYSHDRFWERLEREWETTLDPARWAGVPAEEIAVSLVRLLVRMSLADAHRLRGFLRLAATSPGSSLARRLDRLDGFVSARTGRLVAGACGATPGPSPERVAEAFRVVLSAVREAVLFRPWLEPAQPEARALLLRVTRAFVRGAGFDRCPGTHPELLRMSVRGRLRREP